jgi:hypothetical protein
MTDGQGGDVDRLNATRASYVPESTPGELAFQRLYGVWRPFDPQQAKAVFDGSGLEWWVAGGWAIEAFTGVSRHHEDIDVSFWRRDLPELVRHVRGRYDVWAAGDGSLTPVPRIGSDELVLPENSDQVWLRAHALSPWVADCLLNPDRDGRWVNRREPSWDAPLADITFVAAGVRYLNPEVALAFKAKGDRPKDRQDLEAALPLLDVVQRGWLAGFLDRVHPGHPWRERL